MTAPVNGPFSKTETTLGIPAFNNSGFRPIETEMYRWWFRQAKPFDLPLELDHYRRKCSSLYTSTGPYGSYNGSDPAYSVADIPTSPPTPNSLRELAYSRLIEDVRKAVELGVATAEGRQACGMIVKRLSQMTNFTRYLFSGRFGLAAGALGLDWTSRSVRRKIHTPLPPPRLLRQPKYLARESVRSLSNIYLEFHFGWVPLIKDIYDACEVIQAPIYAHKVRGRAKQYLSDPSNFAVTNQDSGNHLKNDFREGGYRMWFTQQAEIIISNPNLATMNQWGIANPLKVAWELVPFSFVLDWFVNVGDYLGSLTDFAGLTLVNPQRTNYATMSGQRFGSLRPKPGRETLENSASWMVKYEGLYHYRRKGLHGPSIALKAPKPWGYRRGLAAASLLMQAYPKRVVSASALHLARKRTEFRQNSFPQFYGKYW